MSLVLETLFLVFVRIPSLGSEPSFCDHTFGLHVSPIFHRSPMSSRGPVEGRLIFVVVAPSTISTTRGVELTSLASMAQVSSSVSSLTGMFEWNPGPSFVTGSA